MFCISLGMQVHVNIESILSIGNLNEKDLHTQASKAIYFQKRI